MKHFITFISTMALLLLLAMPAFSQEITVRFIGQINGTDYCRLDRVVVTNLTRNWSETLEYPDTIIVLGSTVGANINITAVQGLGQNIPNPFDCETRVELSVSQREDVRMQLLDVAGKLYAEYNGSLDAGVHTFDISAANPQTYLLNAIVGDRQYSIRMVNVGSGCRCNIKYAGVSGGIEAKLTRTNEFEIGDNMRYVGYATINGENVTSAIVEQPLVVNQSITLNFTYYPRPGVETLDATDVTTVSATLNGVVTSDGGLAITSRGFYYGTSDDNLSQNVTATGTGNEFSYALSGLTQGTTYYFRAFATSAAGTSLGETLSFATMPTTPPTVVTLDATNITYTSATINGSIDYDGGLEITEKGFLYGTSADNLSQSANTDGTGAGFSFELSGLSVYTTYYYKAFATNSQGTAYGEIMQFTTLDNTVPTVVTNEATDITTASATLNGNIVSNGGLIVTDCGFQYGTSADNLSSSVMLEMVNEEILTTLTELDDNTTYFYRAYASNSVGTGYGEVLSFTTIGIFPPTVVTLTTTDVTRTTLTLNGSISSDGNSEITARGFYWGTAENDLPNYVASEQTTADFSETISNLEVNTVYYYCAVATNMRGTTLGEVLSSRTSPLTAPMVVTNRATGVNATRAMLNATITDDGGTDITARGFYWGTSADNLVNNISSTDNTNNFSANLTGLIHGSTYYYCAYATNSIGTTLGDVVSFDACLCGDSYSIVTDIDGNQYGTVLIGEQCWMAENLKTTRYSDGADIPLGETFSATDAYRYYPSNYVGNVATYGYLYNWPAAMHGESDSDTNPSGVQGICPNGWHLPSNAEWIQLRDYLETHNYNCGSDTTYIAKSLASKTGWDSSTTSCAVGKNPSSNNSSGFNARPAGFIVGVTYANFGKAASFWGTSLTSEGIAIMWTLSYNYSDFGSGYLSNSRGNSVRCLMDDWMPSIPSVTTDSASNISREGVTLNGNVTSDGNTTVTVRGFVYGTDPDNLSQDVQCWAGTGTYRTNLVDLESGTTYYYKAYATNSAGTAYGEIEMFTTLPPLLLPIVTTTEVSDITSTTAQSGGNVTFDGNTTVTARGVCWSATENPTISDSHTSDGAGTGIYTSQIPGLEPGITYYVCAYATNSVGTSYGEVLSFTTNTALATVVTQGVGSATYTEVTLKGKVTSNGGATITARGFEYGTSADNLSESVLCGNGSGSFTQAITGLAINTTYYYRAYATNSVGTAYGDVAIFKTCNCGGSVKVTDIDGNQYGTVLIGEQCWMSQNLRTTKYADGTSISLGSSASTTTAYRYYPNNSSSNVTNGLYLGLGYGYLYNWKAAMHGASGSSTNPSNVQGVCPNGWHLPSYAEWTQLTDYLSSQSEYQCDGNTTYIAKSLAAQRYWNYIGSTTCAVVVNIDDNNATGFGAVPAGELDNNSDYYFGKSTAFWSATTTFSSGMAYYMSISYNSATVYNGSRMTSYGSSVRCVRDELPSVTTNSATSISSTGATISGSITNATTITERGFVYGTSADNLSQNVQCGSGTGNYSTTLVDLEGGTTYYFKAYATNYVGTSYGELMSFTTEDAIIPSVTTDSVTNRDYTSVTLTGNVTSDGGTNVTECGFVYGTSASNLTQTVQSDSVIGAFSANITGLSANTTYYYKAYAINSVGTAYGAVKSFATCECGGSYKVTDIDGNEYGTVLIGEQCWMAENLRTTKFANGTSIPLGSSVSTTTAYRYYPNNTSTNVSDYGYLYNCRAAACPTGWHLPSDAEWTQLTDYLSSQSEFQCGNDSTYIAKSLASTTGWESSTRNCSVGKNPANNNSTGFRARPAGVYNSNGNYTNFGASTYFLSSTRTSSSSDYNYVRWLYSYRESVSRETLHRGYGVSVRCVKNE